VQSLPAPGTAAWRERTWVRTLLGAIGAALAVVVAGAVLRGLVVDRTDPTAKAGKGSGRGTAAGQSPGPGKRKRSRR